MSAVVLSLPADADSAPDARRVDYGPPPRVAIARRFVDGWASLTWCGLGLAVVGLGCIALGWLRVARETEVYRQLPYLVSAGLTGLALVLAGVTAVNIAARQRDASTTDEQIDRLVDVVEVVGARRSATGGIPSQPPPSRGPWALVGRPERYARPTGAFRASLALAAALIIGGLVAIVVAWHGVATTRIVSHQVPYVVSGGLVGLSLVAIGLVVLNAQARAWSEALRRERIERAIATYAEESEA